MIDLWRGSLSLRRAGVLQAQLPRGARCHEVVGDDRARSEEWLLLRLIEHDLAGANYQRGAGKGAAPKPQPLPHELHAAQAVDETKRARAEQARERHIARLRAQQSAR